MLSFTCRCGKRVEMDLPGGEAGYLVWDADVEQSVERRRALIRAFLNSLGNGSRDDWIVAFYGRNAPPSRLAGKEDVDIIEDILSRHDSWTRHVVRCAHCGRLYIGRLPGNADFECFREESD